MSVIYPQISKPGGFVQADIARTALATPTCFCICRLWQNPVSIPPHHHPSVWMYSTSRSSICFCPPMKRSIIICRMHSGRTANSTSANQDAALNSCRESKGHERHPRVRFDYVRSLPEIFSWTSFYTNIVSIVPFPYKSFHCEWSSVHAHWMMAGSWLTLEWLANVIEGEPPGCETVQSAATEGPE